RCTTRFSRTTGTTSRRTPCSRFVANPRGTRRRSGRQCRAVFLKEGAHMTTNDAAASPRDRARVSELISGYQRSQLALTAARFGLADLLADGPKSIEALAAATETHAPSLGRLLRALVGFGLFELQSDGRFALAPAGALLRDGV